VCSRFLQVTDYETSSIVIIMLSPSSHGLLLDSKRQDRKGQHASVLALLQSIILLVISVLGTVDVTNPDPAPQVPSSTLTVFCHGDRLISVK
jgi:hypothetical protein